MTSELAITGTGRKQEQRRNDKKNEKTTGQMSKWQNNGQECQKFLEDRRNHRGQLHKILDDTRSEGKGRRRVGLYAVT